MFYVGVCRVELGIDDNFSLKGKRSIVKRVIDRTRHRFNVAIGEVEDNDVLDRAVLGFAVVGNDRSFVNSCVDKIVNFIDEIGEAPIEDHQIQILSL
ncbi:MAG: DUF503 domain-containing protein [Myxococcales bacterium]|nr:DUF503 domain-containing protein [Myxococcales bacterium]